MLHTSLLRAAVLLPLLTMMALLAVTPARAAASAGTPADAAAAYLRARAAAAVPGAPAAAVLDLVAPGSQQGERELLIAKGMRRSQAGLGHTITGVECRVTVTDIALDTTGTTATVAARALTTVTWSDAKGRSDTEGSATEHTLVLVLRDGRWLVQSDDYADDLTPRYLEAAGAPATRVAAAAAQLERRSSQRSVTLQPALVETQQNALSAVGSATRSIAGSTGSRLGYRDVIYFDRDKAKAYADAYALTYNPTYVAFSADCANFGSQTMFAGGYPKVTGSSTTGWWYQKNGTSSPSDDSWSSSWVNCVAQTGFWSGRYTDAATSISNVGKGDFIYYDWTGDGRWDHVAELVGTNASGQKVIDAHTTDHYHVYWKLGTSSTRYRFAHTRPYIYIY
jgi:hypothetical protein